MFSWLTSFFANPTLLAGASAGAIPVIIHLLNRQRFKRVWWAAMHWLWASYKKSHRRLQIEQLILLLIRILILILLALALARPALQQGMGLFAGQATVYRIIVLDNSYSMGQLVGGQSLFEKAKKLSVELVRELKSNDEVDVLLANEAAQELTPAKDLAHQQVVGDIQTAKLSDGTTHLPRAIAAACKLIVDRRSKQLRKEIIVITDRTRAGWETASGLKKLSANEESHISKVFDDPKKKPKIWLVRLAGESTGENLAVAGVGIDEKVVTSKVETQLVATVRNLGKNAMRNVPVTLVVDDEKVGHEKIAKLEPLKPETVTFRHTFMEAGSHAVSVSLKPDPLPADNNAFLAVDAAKATKVLCVDGQQRIEKMASELDFFRQALSPSHAEKAHSGRMPLHPEVIDSGRLMDVNLEEYPLIVIANVRLIPKEKVEGLIQYAKRGGCIWIWLGDNVDPKLYNDELGELLPAEIGEAVGRGDPEGPYEALSDKFIDHPAIQKLRNIKGLRMNRLHVYRRLKLMPLKSEERMKTVRSVLSLENGEPVAIENKIGDGRVMLMGTTADKSWCNWPGKNHYMPLINFIALELIRPSYLLRNRTVGEPFVYRLPKEELGAVRRQGLRLIDPNGDPIQMDLNTETFSAFSRATHLAGIYDAELSGETPRTIHFAANRSLEESDLDTIDDHEIKAHLPTSEGTPAESGNILPEIVMAEDVELLDDDFGKLQASLKKHVSGKEIWRWLIGIVLFLLVVESLLAKRFGDHTR